ncbi:MAG: ABC transporter substrate-binding protein [Dehalococcoidia bacterium]|nr:ABC transporter substrate-binding protein [Dehalococcoidia bacterium]
MAQDEVPDRIGRRGFLKVASLAGTGIFIASCIPAAVAPTPTPAAKPTATPAPAGAQAPTAAPKVSAKIEFASGGGGIGLQMLPLLVAQELFVKDEGITQNLTSLSGGGDAVRAVVTGGFNLGHVAPSAAAIAADQDQPIVVIAGLLPFSSIFWIVKADSPLKTVKDLKGKKLGYSRPGSVSDTYARTMLRTVGLKVDTDVTLVAAGAPAEQLTAVVTGIIDAGWCNDPILTQSLLKKEIRILGAAYEYVTSWIEAVYCTTTDYAKANKDVLVAYLRAQQKAMDFIKANPVKAAEIWAKGQDIDPEVGMAAVKNYPLDKFTLKIDPVALKAISSDMLANQQIKTAPNWGKFIDQSFLPPELRSQI